jgi:hypothetical protein
MISRIDVSDSEEEDEETQLERKKLKKGNK